MASITLLSFILAQIQYIEGGMYKKRVVAEMLNVISFLCKTATEILYKWICSRPFVTFCRNRVP